MWATDLFLPNGRLARLHKGGGSGAAVQEQRLAREQSASQFAEQMALMKQQYADAQKVKTPTYRAAAPAAFRSPETYAAQLEQRRRMQRRFGSQATRIVSAPLMGGAVPLAA